MARDEKPRAADKPAVTVGGKKISVPPDARDLIERLAANSEAMEDLRLRIMAWAEAMAERFGEAKPPAAGADGEEETPGTEG